INATENEFENNFIEDPDVVTVQQQNRVLENPTFLQSSGSESNLHDTSESKLKDKPVTTQKTTFPESKLTRAEKGKDVKNVSYSNYS
ncbi:hypothetical protein, partial [Escherichia coli]|uniref:hypothetical protein n=1 Tax=Escherichia coli TaxID=562 RepID=UPI0014130956